MFLEFGGPPKTTPSSRGYEHQHAHLADIRRCHLRTRSALRSRPRTRYEVGVPKRDIGRMGESDFAQCCAQAGLVANRAQTDHGGWDYLVQFAQPPIAQGAVRSLDHLPAPQSFWVQVKAREQASSSPKVKLSNMHRMIAPEWPAFFLVLTYKGNAHPVEAHLVPVDERLIAQILKRLRQVPEGEVNKLHRYKMAIACLDEHRLDVLDGPTLRRTVERHIGPDPAAYYARKRTWYERAGFEGHHYELTLRTRGDAVRAADDRLVDFALGLTDELPSELVRFDERRFGILKPVSVMAAMPTDVGVRIPKLPSEPANVSIQNATGTRRVAFECRFYNPRSIFPFLPLERLRFRLAADLFEMILSPQTDEIDITIHLPSLDSEWLLSELAPALQVVEWLDRGTTDLRGTVSIRNVSAPFGGVAAANLSDMDPVRRAIVRAALDAETLVRVLWQPDEFKITGRSLLAQAPRLADAAVIVRSDVPVEVRGDIDATAPDDARLGFPIITGAPIGRTCVVVGFAFFGVPAYQPAHDGRRTFILKPDREQVLLDTFVMEPGVNYKFDTQIEAVSEWLRARDIIVVPVQDVPPGGALAMERMP